ncbi:MAG: hypothetical protein F7C33_03450 [Desulfurococcales archaeon]|nr:hypothetical protein [Desulfurococcales archaeon]
MPGKRRKEGSVEVWTSLVEEARKAGVEVASNTVGLWRRTAHGLAERLDEVLPVSDIRDLIVYDTPTVGGGLAAGFYEASRKSLVAGIDSSRTRPLPIGLNYVSFVSGVLVILEPPPPGRGPGRVEPMADSVVLPETGDYEHVGLELDLDMFSMEAGALQLASGKYSGLIRGLLMDGPLVDPPSLVSSARRSEASLKAKAEELARIRAVSLAGLWSRGVVVAGFVKRARGRLVAGFLEEVEGFEFLEDVPDSLLALILRGVLEERFRALGACRQSVRGLIVTRPVPLDSLSDRVPDAIIYEGLLEEAGFHGARFYTSLVVPGGCAGNLRRPARVEFLARSLEEARVEAVRVASLVEAWLVPGAWLPSPVLVAHRACTIRSREGGKLLREVASRYALEALHGESDASPLIDIFS